MRKHYIITDFICRKFCAPEYARHNNISIALNPMQLLIRKNETMDTIPATTTNMPINN
jgi:hypothetical protein